MILYSKTGVIRYRSLRVYIKEMRVVGGLEKKPFIPIGLGNARGHYLISARGVMVNPPLYKWSIK